MFHLKGEAQAGQDICSSNVLEDHFVFWKSTRRLVWVYSGPICHTTVSFLEGGVQAGLGLRWSRMSYGRFLFEWTMCRLIWVYTGPIHCKKNPVDFTVK